MEQQLSLALIQTTLSWQDPAKNRDHFAKKMDGLEIAADLIILPEMFTTGFTMTPEAVDKKEGPKTLEWMRQQAQERNAAIVASLPFFENGMYYNRLFFVKPDRTFKWYDKKHTFTLAGEHLKYAAGKERLLISYKGFTICPLICYDLRFPVWARNTDNYDVLLYVANWPKPRIAAWDALLQARAIENMAYCVGVNRVGKDANGHDYTGHSAVYDPLGERLVYSESDTELYVDINKKVIDNSRTKLRFLEDRDPFTLL